MKHAYLKRALAIGTLVTTAAGMSLAAYAAEDLKPGVTVEADDSSATGYTVTFVYEAPEAEKVELRGAFTFYWDDENVRGTEPETYYTPEEWENGMFEAGDESLTVEMTKVDGTDYWTTSMPLPGGHYQYVFLVDEGEKKLEDPTNPMEEADVEAGNHYDRSTFYVPYDAEKQSASIDFSYMAPRAAEESGTVTYVNYVDIGEGVRPLGVYLPAGYDAEREEPYKVIYLSHGGGGNEVDWYAGGSVDYIFDNLIAEGTTEEVILVTMDNTAWSWNFDNIVCNVTDAIIPYMEENYNVSTESADRAFAGLSMGGMTTSNVLYKASDKFGYFAIMSGSDVGGTDFSGVDIENQPVIMLGAGIYDFGLCTDQEEDGFTITGLAAKMDEAGIEYGWEEAYGSHDWNTWPQLIKVFAEEYLWK